MPRHLTLFHCAAVYLCTLLFAACSKPHKVHPVQEQRPHYISFMIDGLPVYCEARDKPALSQADSLQRCDILTANFGRTKHENMIALTIQAQGEITAMKYLNSRHYDADIPSAAITYYDGGGQKYTSRTLDKAYNFSITIEQWARGELEGVPFSEMNGIFSGKVYDVNNREFTITNGEFQL